MADINISSSGLFATLGTSLSGRGRRLGAIEPGGLPGLSLLQNKNIIRLAALIGLPMFLLHLASYLGVWVAVYIFFLTAEANPGGERMLGYCVSFAALADIFFLDASLSHLALAWYSVMFASSQAAAACIRVIAAPVPSWCYGLLLATLAVAYYCAAYAIVVFATSPATDSRLAVSAVLVLAADFVVNRAVLVFTAVRFFLHPRWGTDFWRPLPPPRAPVPAPAPRQTDARRRAAAKADAEARAREDACICARVVVCVRRLERTRAGVRTRTLVRALACTSARSSCTRTNHCSSFLH
jgi:hypothetical protein